MRELHALDVAGEHHGVIADDRSAAERVDRDLAGRTLPRLAVASVDRLPVEVYAASRGDGLREHQRGARRRVLLVAVVHLRHLDVVFRTEHLRGLADKLEEEVDAERVVPALHYGDPLRRLVYGLLLLRRQAGRPDDVRYALLGGLRDCRGNRRVEGEVHHSLDVWRPLAVKSLRDVDLRDDLAPRALRERAEHPPHASRGA